MPRKRKTTATPVETPVSTEITTGSTGTGPVTPPQHDTTPAVEVSVAPTEELAVFTNSTATHSPSPEPPAVEVPGLGPQAWMATSPAASAMLRRFIVDPVVDGQIFEASGVLRHAGGRTITSPPRVHPL